ncbi:MAG TPA: hypothetical protein VFT71_07220 [Candidatus Nitrosocosmicus sp.]|nr:hypothetical protein [Candidatus Nitrosocosmicus sp.]
MNRGQKMAILLSVPIIIGTAVIIGLVAPTAYLNLCKLKVNEISNQIYILEGGEEEFLRSLNQQNLSNEVQKELQNLNSVIAQCPELRSYTNNDSRFGLIEQQSNNSNTIN